MPSLAARTNSLVWANPLLSLFPVPNGPDLGGSLALWTGSTSRPSRLDTGAVRLDHTFTSWLTAFARFNQSPSSTEFGNSTLNTLDLSSRSLTVGFDVRAKPNLYFDLRLNYAYASANSVWSPPGPTQPCDLEPTTFQFLHVQGVCDYLIRFSVSGVGQVESGSEGQRTQTQFQVSPTGNWNIKNHAIRFGSDYRRLAPARRDASGSLNILADTVQGLGSSADFWVDTAPQLYVSAVVREAALFAQDTWKALPRLTFSYGVRWEISPAPVPGGAPIFVNQAGNLLPAHQPLWQSAYANFAPRIGVALQPTAGGRTVIRAGAGLYYDSSLSLAADLVNGGPLAITNYGSPRLGFTTTSLTFGFAPQLRLPAVRQWNVSIEHAVSNHDVVSVGYVGSSASDLIRRDVTGLGTTQSLALATNDGLSNYQSLQAQYRRRLSHGFEALASYAWSHSIDDSSTDSGLYGVNSYQSISADRASSDFDVRHSFSAGFTYALPHSIPSRLARDWELDGTFRARSGFPINVMSADEFQGISYENVYRPNLLGGVPLWINDPSAPGGRSINPAAFQVAPFAVQGNLGRNALAGFGMSQLDLALQRDFLVSEQRSLQFRVEAYNAFNHPNFADPIPFLASPLFGQSTSMLNLMLGTGSPGSGLAPIFQAGGPRSLRVVFRFRF